MAGVELAGGVALASSIAMGGCFGIYLPGSGDACERAQEHLAECLGPDVVGETSEQFVSCTEQTACVAACINGASCDTIKAAFGGMGTGSASGFIGCLTGCANGPTGTGAASGVAAEVHEAVGGDQD